MTFSDEIASLRFVVRANMSLSAVFRGLYHKNVGL